MKVKYLIIAHTQFYSLYSSRVVCGFDHLTNAEEFLRIINKWLKDKKVNRKIENRWSKVSQIKVCPYDKKFVNFGNIKYHIEKVDWQ